ncbi:CrpP-related protein [Achromobacter xylosoxidans]|uniref:CrpP-related protein n=1 Tax=Alcaligenes xylosoxydans xylosoxydans TaxID=85698 RepID=UPI0006C5564C|nr:Uncharacterised protein [Achromobacter xylosoxidans]
MEDAPRYLGYRAAARGQLLESCPFMRPDKLPTRTGENLTEWRKKVEAWEQGWHDCVNERPRVAPLSTVPADKTQGKAASH